MFVSDASCDHMVETYSSMGLVMALYVAMIVSFCFPHVVDVSALSICIVLRAFVVVISMCLLYVSLGSRVSPSMQMLYVCVLCASCGSFQCSLGARFLEYASCCCCSPFSLCHLSLVLLPRDSSSRIASTGLFHMSN